MKKDGNLYVRCSDVIVIHVRDVNGKKHRHIMWDDEVETYVNQNGLNDEELEILMITVDNVCIYSSLASPSITWEEVIGFFA